MAKLKGFFKPCSSRACEAVNAEVARSYDRVAHKVKPAPKYKGGIEMRMLEPARVPILGESGEYTVGDHGMSIEFRRCREFNFIDRHTHKQTSETCTDRRVFNIPRNAIRCYEHTSSILAATARGKEGKPVTTRHKILALVACSKDEPVSPAIISA